MKTPPPSCAPKAAQKLNVSEIFYSIQGEGKHTGLAAVFVRLAGCSMGCEWCDSKYAQKTTWRLTPAQVLARVKKYPARVVIITGGEPCEQDLQPLLKLLAKNKYQIHLETNGSVDIDASLVSCLTVSPKRRLNAQMLKKADVLKLVVDAKTARKQILQYLKTLNPKTFFCLQPEGNHEENIKKCLKIIKANPQIKLSLQTHKLIKIK